MVPIRCSEEDIRRAKNLFSAVIAEFPIKYLGVPLLVTKLSKTTIQRLTDKVADRGLTWKDKLLHHSSRLALLKSTLSAIPGHIMINIALPPWAIRAPTKIMKVFLWIGTDALANGKCIVAWSAVQRPLQLGRLGVLDLQLFGNALRLRWLWTQRTRALHDPPRLMIDDLSQALTEFFHNSVWIEVGDGTSILFWTDK